MNTKSVITEFENWLDTTLNFEKRPIKGIFWLKTMEFLCNRFNNPQNEYLSFHVAGSKGKGSVSCFMACILEAAGKKCGLYTSPHIVDLRERIGLAHSFFTDDIYASAITELIPRVDSIIPDDLPGGREGTWFELLTLFSFLCFKQAQVDCAVFETGMGGRLDATNVIKPECCCLTPIELEHCEFLGDTLQKIAAEKAGIIKQNTPVFSSAQKDEVRAVFKAKAAELNAPLYFIDELVDKISVDDTVATDASMNATIICSRYFSRPLHIQLRMPGEFQVWNAALAAIAIKSRFPEITEEQIEQGIASAKLPGRFEVAHFEIKEHPLTIVFDGAHTVNSLSFTLENFYRYFGPGADILFACAADKKMDDMSQLVCSSNCAFSSIMLTRPGENKQSNYDVLLKAFSDANIPHYGRSPTILSGNPNFTQAIKDALNLASCGNKTLLVSGSFYLVAEVKKILAQITVAVA
jgi:dihydrofolate synthase/folylpolyglutamate synthase